MTTPRTLPTRADSRSEDGSVTVFFAVAALGLLLALGLIVDGGAKVAGLQRADRLAAEAARAAGQVIDTPGAIQGDTPRVDPARAVAAAQAYLRANDVQGAVTLTQAGRGVQVQVTTHIPTVFLGLIGITTMETHGSAEASLVRGVTGAGQ
jgi:hypothetical protein